MKEQIEKRIAELTRQREALSQQRDSLSQQLKQTEIQIIATTGAIGELSALIQEKQDGANSELVREGADSSVQ